MAKFELKFYDYADKKTTIQTEKTKSCDGLWIEIIDRNGEQNLIVLDKSTAIKFAKTLRTEINKITESEVSNG